MTKVADFVAPGRCTCCGHALTSWSPDGIVSSLKKWVRENGRVPRARDWKRATPDHPAYTTVGYVFGGWNQMLRASGIEVRGSGRPLLWTKQQVADLMLDEVGRRGEWPRFRDWMYADPNKARPSATTVVTLFGSWNEAKLYAGWNGVHPRRVDKGTKRKRSTVCAGCGCDLDDFKSGCVNCAARHSWRRQSGYYDRELSRAA